MASLIDDEAGKPGWWLRRLLPALDEQARRADMLDRYYRGEQNIPIGSKKVRDAYKRLMAISHTNFAELIVEAVRERMVPAGFRTGADGDATGDSAAWAMWQANSLDADSNLVHRAKLSMAASYVIVGKDDNGDVVITPEDPRQVVAELDPVRRRKVRAALKVFHDDLADVDRAFLYLPGFVFKAQRSSSASTSMVSFGPEGWEWEPDTPEELPGTDVVPVVPFLNRADLFGRPQGEFEGHLPLLDRINYTVLSRLEIATLQAFRQRAVKGVPVTDANGVDIDYSDVFAADPGALWLLPETAELWESGQVDLGPIRSALLDDVEHLAAVSRTPMHYFAPAGANQSAEGASLSRESLIFKTKDQLSDTGESWETVMAIGFLFAGDEERSRRGDMEILWNAPERHSLAERADAAVKAQAAGVPWRTVMADIMEYTPQQVDRMMAERLEDNMLMESAIAAVAPAAFAPAAPAAPVAPAAPAAPVGQRAAP